MAGLPLDVIRDILPRMAVTDLLRFRCVSKFFESLISSPSFIKLHLSRAKKAGDIYGVSKSSGILERPKIFKLSHVTKSVTNDSLATVHRLPFQYGVCWDVVGSCNGLIALRNRTSEIGDILFWNPFTGKSKRVDFKVPRNSKISYGFGYDPETDDYKLVRVAVFNSGYNLNPLTLKTVIYSLKTNSWKKLDEDWSRSRSSEDVLIWPNEAGVLANNALHWVINDEKFRAIILVFDLVKEEFHYLQSLRCNQFVYHMKLSVLDGCLAVISPYQNRVSVWIMKEYGVDQSWTKVMSYWRCDFGNIHFINPLAYSRCRDKILLCCNQVWYWYDLASKMFEFWLRGDNVVTFTESLVSPNDNSNGSCDVVDTKSKKRSWNITEKKEEKRRKRR